jgi:hypothetical protein
MEDDIPKRKHLDGWVDLGSVLLISAATVLTAWCGYEGARWTAVQTRLYNTASADRINGSVAAARANALETFDVATFLMYVRVVGTQDTKEADFIYKRFRPEMKRAVVAWIATKPLLNPNAPPTPFAMPQYHLATQAEADRLSALASASFKAATEANEIGDSYVRLTVIFAAVLFLAGVSTKFVFPYHIVVIVAGLATLAFGLIRLFVLPMQ